MTDTRERVARIASEHLPVIVGDEERYECAARGCDWTAQIADERDADAQHGRHLADVLAAAGLLRDDEPAVYLGPWEVVPGE